MHSTHIENIKAARTNIRHAIWNKEACQIGGGEFSPDEMRSVLLALEWCLSRQEEADKKHD